jgi:hypothetical protein
MAPSSQDLEPPGIPPRFKKLLPKAFDQILYYVKSKNADFVYNALQEERSQPVRQL